MPYSPEQRELLQRARAACADGTVTLELYSAAIAIMRQGRYAALQAQAKPKAPRKRKAKVDGAALLDSPVQEPTA